MPCRLQESKRTLSGAEFINHNFERELYGNLKPTMMYNPCKIHKHSQVSQTAVQHPVMSIRDGFGYSGREGQLIDKDSMLRNGTLQTQTGGKILLPNPGFLTIPYMGHGRNNTCTSKIVLEEESGRKSQSCLPPVARTSFIPLLGCIADQVQNTKHIIQEDVKKDWVRGGVPSRKCCITQRKIPENHVLFGKTKIQES